MSKPPRRKFSEEDKRRAVEEYVTGKRSVVNIAEELNVATGLIYKWKSDFELKAKKGRVADLTEAGATRAMAIKIQQQEEEIAAYQKKVAELTIINDLLKKLQTPSSYQSESELSGLIDTIKQSGRKQRLAK